MSQEITIIGELGQGEMAALMMPRGVGTPHIKKLRETHHRLARLLATGTKEGHVAAVSGYSLSRLSILKNDPAFQELVQFYREEVHDVHLDAEKQLADLRSDAVRRGGAVRYLVASFGVGCLRQRRRPCRSPCRLSPYASCLSMDVYRRDTTDTAAAIV